MLSHGEGGGEGGGEGSNADDLLCQEEGVGGGDMSAHLKLLLEQRKLLPQLLHLLPLSLCGSLQAMARLDVRQVGVAGGVALMRCLSRVHKHACMSAHLRHLGQLSLQMVSLTERRGGLK